MPGLVIVKRRWNIGSDDLVLPATFYLFVHILWIGIYLLFCWRNASMFLDENSCSPHLTFHVFGQFILIIAFVILEICIIKVSLRGSILNANSRSSLNTLLYIWFILLLIEVLWEIYGLVIMIYDTKDCALSTKEKIYGLKIYMLIIWISLLCFVWCAFDPAGRSWFRMKRFQESLNNPNSKYKYRRSNSSFHRNWRHREALRKYEKSWTNRCRILLCIRDRSDNSFTEIAKLFTEFFRDLDVVPSDVIAALSLMRVQQKALRKEKIKNSCSDEKIFQFLSGAPITSETKFLDLTHPMVIKEVYNLIHYLHYSIAIYGWPMYVVGNSPSKWCHLMNHIKCCGNKSSKIFNCRTLNDDNDNDSNPEIVIDSDNFINIYNNYNEIDNIAGDNCCLCNRAAIHQTCINHEYKIIYITYQVAVGQPPFFVAIDYEKMSIVICIRGTISLYDVMTDLTADYDLLPVDPPKETWYGHKGMISAASYIRSKLLEKRIIEIANEELKLRNYSNKCQQYPIVIVGHSLGGGTGAILAILLKEIYDNVICFAFAPPGGLISKELAEYTKDFVVSLVLGKDIVPRMGLHQMEKLRFDLIKSMKYCDMTKWGIIFKSCCYGRKDISTDEFVKEFKMTWDKNLCLTDSNTKYNSNSNHNNEDHHKKEKNDEVIDKFKSLSQHPNDENICLTVHTPLYPPGSIIHLVKNHPNKSDLLFEPKWRRLIGKKHFIIQALWAGYNDFNEILISPSMISDHMPDKILEALESLLIKTGPSKPPKLKRRHRSGSLQESDEEKEDDTFTLEKKKKKRRRKDKNRNNNEFGKRRKIEPNSNYYTNQMVFSTPTNSSDDFAAATTTTKTATFMTSNINDNCNNDGYDGVGNRGIILETSFTATTTGCDIYEKEPIMYNEARLKRLKKLILKGGNAPLATPESISLAEDYGYDDEDDDDDDEVDDVGDDPEENRTEDLEEYENDDFEERKNVSINMEKIQQHQSQQLNHHQSMMPNNEIKESNLWMNERNRFLPSSSSSSSSFISSSKPSVTLSSPPPLPSSSLSTSTSFSSPVPSSSTSFNSSAPSSSFLMEISSRKNQNEKF